MEWLMELGADKVMSALFFGAMLVVLINVAFIGGQDG